MTPKEKARMKQREIEAHEKGYELALRTAIGDVRQCLDGLLALYKASTE